MAKPPVDRADQRSTRRRDKKADPSDPSDRGDGGSVFAPGYDASRPESPDRGQAGTRTSGSDIPWYGSTAGGAAGRGPVRGYPPVPGQPPPMYPPGQFAAWNRGSGRVSQAGPASAGPASAGQSARTQSGPHTGPATSGAVRPGLERPRTGHPGPQGPPGGPQVGQLAWEAAKTDGTPATSRYYDRDLASGGEPGYSMLAVSDPAADVTSTQTWQAAGDGRTTGMWTALPKPDGGPESPGRAAAVPTMPEPGDRATGRPGLTAPGRPGDTSSLADETDGRAAESGRRGARGHSGPQTSPHSQVPAARPDDPRRPSGTRGAAGTRPRRKRPASVKLAMATALVLVLAAAAALSYAVLRNPGSQKAAAPPARKPASSPSASPSPSLGPYGHIASRKADPAPLTMVELYPVTFTAGGTSIVRTTASKSTNCAANLVGSGIQGAIGSAGCAQVVRATYLASASGLMGTIGVLNLSTAKAATTAARAADASDFISQLAARHGPTHKIGQGTGIEEAAAKGHYLILIWAEFTNLRKPRTAAQRTQVEQFMTELLQHTANVSLSNRMLTGSP